MARKKTKKAITDNSGIIAKAVNEYLRRSDAISAAQVAAAHPFYEKNGVSMYGFQIGKHTINCQYKNGVCTVRHVDFSER